MLSPTILILDPHRELTDMAGEVLRSRGYRVRVAERFEAAAVAINTIPTINVAVCHATLPSGEAEAVPIFGVLAARLDIALVVISSRPFEEVPGIPSHAIRLSKPFGAGELLSAVERAAVPTRLRKSKIFERSVPWIAMPWLRPWPICRTATGTTQLMCCTGRYEPGG